MLRKTGEAAKLVASTSAPRRIRRYSTNDRSDSNGAHSPFTSAKYFQTRSIGAITYARYSRVFVSPLTASSAVARLDEARGSFFLDGAIRFRDRVCLGDDLCSRSTVAGALNIS